MDLQTLEITEVKALEDQRGKIVYCHPETWYFIRLEYAPSNEEPILKALYRFKQGNLELVREFEPMNIGYMQSQNYFGVYDTGFVLKRNGKISVYSLPDLQPIPFEDLD